MQHKKRNALHMILVQAVDLRLVVTHRYLKYGRDQSSQEVTRLPSRAQFLILASFIGSE